MTYNVNKTLAYSSVIYQTALEGLGNSMTFASNSIAVGDINGDGFNDIFCAPWVSGIKAKPLVLIGDGTGKFANKTSQYFAASVTFDVAKTVSIGDYNSDGLNDLIVFDTGSEDPSDYVNGNFPGAQNQYFQQTSTGFVLQPYLPNNDTNTFNHASMMADIDGDGDTDYLGTQLGGPNFTGYGLTLGENVNGQFVDKSALLPIEIRYKLSADWSLYTGVNVQTPGSVSVADLNNDGRMDIITASYGADGVTNNESVRISTQNSDGTFSQTTVGYVPQSLKDEGCVGAVSISAGDIDNDGLKDLAIVWEGVGVSGLQILHNDGNNSFSDVTVSALGSNLFREVNVRDATGNYMPLVSSVTFADADLDGFVDLIFGQMGSSPDQYINSSGHSTGNSLFLNDKSGHFIGWTPNLTSTQFINVVGASEHPWGAGDPVIADVNGDKRMDMIFIDGINGSTITVNSVIASASSGSSTVSSTTGTSSNDKLIGTSGNDTLNGGAGVDKMTGNAGADSFVFDNIAVGGADKITDFKLTDGDVFVFDVDVFTSLAGGLAAENVVISAKPKAVDENDYLLFSTKGKLYYDADGSGSGAAVLIAGVKGSFSGIDYQSFQIV